MNILDITRKAVLAVMVLGLFQVSVMAQDTEESELEISGSVDTYYTYDFSGVDNIGTSFANERNSVSVGMVDLMMTKTMGKASFVGEVAFGPRASSSAPGAIQNLYVSYAVSDGLTLTAGFMGTFVGYEVISPAANFNYSTSYLFSNGPFQNAGLKADISLGENAGLMVGIFQSAWDSYTSDPAYGVSELGAQLSLSPVDGWDVYLNYITGSLNGEIDLTTGYQVSDAVYVGLNVANRFKAGGDDEAGFVGFAGYLQFGVSETTTLGVRAESFSDSGSSAAYIGSAGDESSVFGLTFSANIKAGGLTFIPEFRVDSSSDDLFTDDAGAAKSSASQVTLAAVYSF